MSKLLGRLNLVGICLLGGVLAAVLWVKAGAGTSGLGQAAAQAQTPADPSLKTLTVTSETFNRHSPVAITKVTVGDKQMLFGVAPASSPSEIFPGTPFEATHDWLSTIEIYLTNKAKTPVAFLNFLVHSPFTRPDSPSGPTWGRDIQLGRMPLADAFSGDGRPIPLDPKSKALGLQPGKTITVRLADYMDGPNGIKAIVERATPGIQASGCDIQVTWLLFDDGTQWTVNGFAVPDASRLGKFIPVSPKEAPGHARE
jgi:hypothetical protein